MQALRGVAVDTKAQNKVCPASTTSQKVQVGMTPSFVWCFYLDNSMNCRMGLKLYVRKKFSKGLFF